MRVPTDFVLNGTTLKVWAPEWSLAARVVYGRRRAHNEKKDRAVSGEIGNKIRCFP